MSRIRVKNFGPIREGYQKNEGWVDIKKVSTFIGDQGSGKSTLAKLISTFIWFEKALFRGDFGNVFSNYSGMFRTNSLEYHRLENYFHGKGDGNTKLEYEGEAYKMVYEKGKLQIEKKEPKSYELPQIMYVPAERNFISYVRSPKELKLSSESLKEFLTEFENAKRALKGTTRLPINNVEMEYDEIRDLVNIKGNDFAVELSESSSGFQSLVPLYLVSKYLADRVRKSAESRSEPMSVGEIQRFMNAVDLIYANEDLTEEQIRAAISVLSSRFNKTAFINIVEEPEQNLFPSSQWHMLRCLLEYNNMGAGNKLIMTTHSPYIINYLSIAIQGHDVKSKIEQAGKTEQLIKRLEQIIPLTSLIPAEEVVVYQFDEKNGIIDKLDSIEGIPSDSNFLNDMQKEGNHLFDSLLEIEEEI